MKHLAFALFVAACSATGSTPAPQEPPQSTAAAPAFSPTAFTVKVIGTGRPVIFIPGLASPASVWDHAVAHLTGRVQAHVLTLAGFAGAPPISPPFLQQVHDQIVQYIKANNLQKPIVVGHSLGGVMSLWLAETDPDIGGIVDVDGFPFLAAAIDPSMTAASAAAQGKMFGDQMANASQAQLAGQMKQFMAAMITNPDDLQRVADAAGKSDPATVGAAFAEMFALDLRPELGKIAMPVLIVAATDSQLALDKLQAAWHAQVDPIKGVDLELVGNAKHFVMLDQPDVFDKLLDTALAR
ncbi:MAG TPA: alpha/beta hydrolase [Kofleriaceae bacterium]|nr:alpha/beta hydrolase [Kofleriaceae bacterium]